MHREKTVTGALCYAKSPCFTSDFGVLGYCLRVDSPSVCVILPVLDEYDAVDDCLSSLRAQTYIGPMTVIVADGGSIDGTTERLAEWSELWPAVRVIDNPDRVQSVGLWLAANATDAEILVRADAHTTYAPDYVERSVDALTNSGAVAVGGPMRPVAAPGFQAAVADAMASKWAIGPAPFHHGGERRDVDTVYLGAFRRSDFLAAGGMRTLPSHVAEDADLYFRWRQAGKTILMDPEIESHYTPRETPGSLWRQFYRYGLGKADMLLVTGTLPSPRPLAPLALIVGLAGGLIMLPWLWWPLALLAVVWLGNLFLAFKGRPAPTLAGAIMHLSYGLGLLRGLLRRPSAVRAAVRENTPPVSRSG